MSGTKKFDGKIIKNQKRKQSRHIGSELNDPALNKESILSVNDFLKSRKFEITELEKAQLNSKFASSTRIFQHLPRKLRRRTASHNVKRIPKRLRNRAIREMSKSDTPVIKKKKLKGRELYRLRTARSLLRLAASASLAQCVPKNSSTSLNKLKFRQRIKILNKRLSRDNKEIFHKINNKVGAYDISGLNELSSNPIGKYKFMKRQKDFVWLNSHVWHAKRAHMIKRWGYQIPSRPTQKSFKLAHRSFNSSGALIWDRSFIGTIVLQSDNQNSLVELLQKVSKSEKIGKRYFGNGSIFQKLIYDEDNVLGEITIISFTDDLIFRNILRVHPSIYKKFFDILLSLKTEDIEVVDNRFSIGSIDVTGPVGLKALGTVLSPFDHQATNSQFFTKLSNEANLPDNTIFTFQAKDPRIVNRKKPRVQKDLQVHDILIDMKTTKSNLDNDVIRSLFTADGRTASYENQLSLKDLQKLKKDEIKPNSKFPAVLYKNNGMWTLLLPWFWVLPVWYQLNHIAHINIGGLFQTHQYHFEHNQLHFPDDFPFTKAGLEENQLRSTFKKSKWEKKPRSKKFNYEKLKLSNSKNEYAKGELGDPFGCDWRYLQALKIGLSKVISTKKTRTSDWTSKTHRKVEQLHDVYEYIKDVSQNDQEAILHEKPLPIPVKLSFTATKPEIPLSIEEPLPIIPISLTVLGKGNPTDNARIYSIPSSELPKWLNAHTATRPTGKKLNEYPEVPHSSNLIGFITSGSFNLSKGLNTGVGAIDAIYATTVGDKEKKYCLVRNTGSSVARLALWRDIKI